MVSSKNRRESKSIRRRVGMLLFILGIATMTTGQNSKGVLATSGPTPMIWLDATNANSYPGTGTTWTDLSPNGRNGTLVGAVTFNSTSKTLQFPGGVNGTAYVSLAANMSSFSNGITIEFEGEFGAVRSDWERIFDFALGVGQTADAFWVGQFANFNELAIETFNAGNSQGYCYTTTNQTALGSAGDRTLNKWVITIDATSPFNCRIYKNGVELGTRATPFAQRNFNPTGSNANGSPYALPLTTSRPSSFLGRSNFVADRDLEGSIRFIRLYDQTLTPTQVSNNANATVTFAANGGTGTMNPQTSTSSAALTSNTFSRNGFTFLGWNTDPNGQGVAYADGATYLFSSDITLHAQWLANPTTTAAATTTTTAPTTTTVVPTTTAVSATSTSVPTAASATVTTTNAQTVSASEASTSRSELVQTGSRSEDLAGVSIVLLIVGAVMILTSMSRKPRH